MSMNNKQHLLFKAAKADSFVALNTLNGNAECHIKNPLLGENDSPESKLVPGSVDSCPPESPSNLEKSPANPQLYYYK